jgi:hypothetical protein
MTYVCVGLFFGPAGLLVIRRPTSHSLAQHLEYSNKCVLYFVRPQRFLNVLSGKIK